MRCYLAAAYKRREEIKRVAEELRAIGVEVTSTWLESEETDHTAPAMRNRAYLDVLDILHADTVIRFTDWHALPPYGLADAQLLSGARHFEMGLAYWSKKRLIVVGGHQNVFDYLDEVTHVADFEELKEKLTSWQVN